MSKKFVKILEICKDFSENLVNECGNIPRRGQVPKLQTLGFAHLRTPIILAIN